MDNWQDFYYSLFGYTAKLAHIFGAFIWIGGVLFMAGIATPIVKYYQDVNHYDIKVIEIISKLERRLIGFNWMAYFAMLFGGVVLTLHNKSFSLFTFNSLYSWLLHGKIFLFTIIGIVNYLMSISYKELKTARVEKEVDEDLSPYEITEWRVVILRRINVYLCFSIILILAFL
ncbi:MAG: hypothetical protein IPP08_01295 [Chlorobiota bacterium]|jgi:uncharacterized membrane protein|nr:hypothetical protein [Chlorobiota bacterium]QQS66838.1 MAG: hypothetical protein IPP08_01295 [Chlorobiota bacterium]